MIHAALEANLLAKRQIKYIQVSRSILELVKNIILQYHLYTVHLNDMTFTKLNY